MCNAGEDLVIFTASANGPLQCDAAAGSGAGSGVGANTGTVVVSDFSALSRKGLGWVQAGMVCFDLGCNQAGAVGGGEWPDGDADAGNFAPTPAPVAVNANMAPSQGATAASSSSSSNLSFASKRPTIRNPSSTRRASAGRTLSATRLSSSTPAASWVPVPYSFAATPTAASVPIQASVVSDPVAAAPAAPQQQCRFAVCKPRGQQQSWSNAGH